MIRKYRILFISVSFLLFNVFFIGCKTDGTEQKKESKNLDDVAIARKKVMAIHDETMMNMDSIVHLKIALKQHLAGDNTPEMKDSLETNLKRLENAHDIMMDWMHNYQEPEKGTDHDQKLAYMQEQLKKIQLVKEQMHTDMQLAAHTVKP